jgi:hypothetical protein
VSYLLEFVLLLVICGLLMTDMLMFAVQVGDKQYARVFRAHLTTFMDVWLGKRIRKQGNQKWVTYTKRGMAYQNPVGSDVAEYNQFPGQGGLGNTMNAAMLSLLYAKYGMVTGTTNMQVGIGSLLSSGSVLFETFELWFRCDHYK